MQKTLATVAACVLASLALQSCSPETDNSSQGNDSPMAGNLRAGSTDGTLELIETAEHIYEGEGSHKFRQLLADRKFTDTTPEVWQESTGNYPLEWSLAGAASTGIVEDPTGLEAPLAVELVGANQALVLTQTTAILSESSHSPAFIATAWAKTDAVNGAVLAVKYETKEGPNEHIAIHPGDGKWHELVIHEALVSRPFAFTFTLTGGPEVRGQRVSFGPTSLRIADEAPAPSANLLADANFDRLGFTRAKGTGAWFTRAWGGNTTRDVEVVATPERPEGSYAVSFPAVEKGVLALVQEARALDDSDRGKAIVAEVWAKCDVENGLQLLLEATYPDGTVDKKRAPVTEPGDWQRLRTKYTLPESGALPTIVLSVLRRGGEDSKLALVDDMFVGVDGQAAKAPTPSAKAPAPSAAEAPAPSAMEPTPPANLVKDANFDRLGAGGAKNTGAWHTRAWGGNTNKDAEIVAMPEGPEGGYVLSFPAFEEGVLAIVQGAGALDDSHRGKGIVAQAWAKCDVENGIQLLIEATYPDGTVEKKRTLVSEPGDWQRLRTKYTLPESGALPSVTLSLLRLGGKDSELALVDDVFFGFEGEAGATNNLLDDSNFERLGSTGAKNAGAWHTRAWGGNTTKDVEIIALPEGPEGGYALSFPALEQGVLALVQEANALDDSHHGKTIVVQAWAKCDVENGFQLLFEATYPDGTVDKKRVPATEPGDWQRLRTRYTLPDSGALPTVTVSLLRRSVEDSKLALVDDVFVGVDG